MTVASPVGTVTTWSFDATGAEQTFVLPRHDGQIRIAAKGATGANGGLYPTGLGGTGGDVTAWATVAAGVTIAAFPGDIGAFGGAQPSAYAGGLGTGSPGSESGTGGAGTRLTVERLHA